MDPGWLEIKLQEGRSPGAGDQWSRKWCQAKFVDMEHGSSVYFWLCTLFPFPAITRERKEWLAFIHMEEGGVCVNSNLELFEARLLLLQTNGVFCLYRPISKSHNIILSLT